MHHSLTNAIEKAQEATNRDGKTRYVMSFGRTPEQPGTVFVAFRDDVFEEWEPVTQVVIERHS